MADTPQDPPKVTAPPFYIQTSCREELVRGHGRRLRVAMQLMAGPQIPLSHIFEVPGEAVPLIVKQLERIQAEFPALTTELVKDKVTVADAGAVTPTGTVLSKGPEEPQ